MTYSIIRRASIVSFPSLESTGSVVLRNLFRPMVAHIVFLINKENAFP